MRVGSWRCDFRSADEFSYVIGICGRNSVSRDVSQLGIILDDGVIVGSCQDDLLVKKSLNICISCSFRFVVH